MLKYLRYSDMSVRLSLNPFNWVWSLLPKVSHDGPTPFFPNRHTYAIVWLFFQVFLDVDNGVTDFESYRKAFNSHFNTMDAYDEEERLATELHATGKGSVDLEQRPKY
jgi:hypothetical protein